MTDTLAEGAYADPDWGYEIQVNPRVNYLNYGDGYKSRIADGLNSQLRKVTLSWSQLLQSEYNLLSGFFAKQNGITSFFWTPYGDDQPGVWLCSKWTPEPFADGRWKLTAELQEVPDLDQ